MASQRDAKESGQIIATSHDLTPNGGLVREIPLFQGNLGWWNIIPFGQKGMQMTGANVFGRILSDRDIDTWVEWKATSLMTNKWTNFKR